MNGLTTTSASACSTNVLLFSTTPSVPSLVCHHLGCRCRPVWAASPPPGRPSTLYRTEYERDLDRRTLR